MQPQQPMAGGAGAPPTATEQALGKGLQIGGAVAGGALGLGKAGAGKGLSYVKEMDPGQIGLLIKILNIGVGLTLSVWAGVFMVLEIGSYVSCGTDTTDPTCCPNNAEGAIECKYPMSVFDNFSALVISIYMVPLGAILILYEISTRRVGAQESVAEPTGIWAKVAAFRESLMMYFGFIFFYKRRTQFLVFVGFLCLGNQAVDGAGESGGSPAPLVAGILALVNAVLHFAVRMQHPEFDQSMQQALSAADDEAMEGAPGGGAVAPPREQQYMPEQEDIYQAPAAAAPAPMYAPAPAPASVYAPAPAPASNIYGGDDGGTAI